MPPELDLPFRMQALELKPTDVWEYLKLPAKFVEYWFLTKTILGEYLESLRESG